MIKSDSIKELAAALAKAQGEIKGAAKDSANPYFKSRYADLASVWDACREPLAKNGLAVSQFPSADGPHVTVETVLMHESGEWMSRELTVTAKEDSPQAIGSAVTYARRYSLAAVVGVAPEDDDGEAAEGRRQVEGQQRLAAAKKRVEATTDAPNGKPTELQGARTTKEQNELYLQLKDQIARAATDDELTTLAELVKSNAKKMTKGLIEMLSHEGKTRREQIRLMAEQNDFLDKEFGKTAGTDPG